ncbi:MAG: ABC transporter permease [Vicinamibacteria bacterium]
MRFLPLITANLLRKKVRLALTIGSFAVALFLFGLLATVRAAFSQVVDVAGADRLVITNKVSLIQPLPIAYRERILRVPGVKAITSFSWFGGVYQDEKNFFPQFAIDPENHLGIYDEFEVPEADWQAFLADRAGCIAGRATADRFGWKLGDRIPIRGTIFEGAWEFNLRGIYTGSKPNDDLTQFWFHAKYLEEKAPEWNEGRIGWYALRIERPDDALRVTKAIDESFANSAFETRTQTEQALAASFAKQMGNIEFLIMTIGSVVFFTLLLVTGNTMATVVRERTPELAVLKAVGYGDGFVLGLVLVESCLVALVGAGIGLGLAKLFTLRGDPTGGLLPVFYLPAEALAAGVVLGFAVGLASGILPALTARRLRVIDALRRL